MAKLDDYEFKGVDQQVVDFKDDVRDMLNSGKYQASLATTGIPGWTANQGEFAFYRSGSDRRLYLRAATAWMLVGGFDPTLNPSSLGTVNAGTGNTFALVDHIHPTATVSVAIGTFTRDTTLASGTQAVTGVGFQPTAVLLLAIESSTREASWGFDNGTTAVSIYDNAGGLDAYATNATQSIFLEEASGTDYRGEITSLDTDGFTVTWTRTGAPTGTATVRYLAFR